MRLILRRGVGYLGICLLLLVMGCSVSKNTEQSAHPYASDEPIESPRTFLPNIISTEETEDIITFSPDGQTVYFSRLIEADIKSNIYSSTFDNGHWGEPQKLSFSIEGRDDFWPFMTLDGKRLYFGSNRNKDNDISTTRINRIWYVERNGEGWGKPQLEENIPSGNFSISENGTFYVARLNGPSEDILQVKWTDGQFEKPVKLSSNINDPGFYNTSPYIAPDESFLIFERYTNQPEASELYISYNRNGEWSIAEKLNESVNESGYLSYAGRISPDGKYLFFAKGKRGNIDVYQLDLKEVGLE